MNNKTLHKENKAPKVEPIHVKEFTVKQSKYEVWQATDKIGHIGTIRLWQNSAAAKHDPR